MKRCATVILGGTLVAVLGACAPTSDPARGPVVEGEPALVQVTNNNWLDMAVYAVRSGLRVRLGTVTSLNTETFTVPRALMTGASAFQLVADPIGSSGTFKTQSVSVWPGQTVKFQIENQIGISNVSTWD